MVVNDNAENLTTHGDFGPIASKPSGVKRCKNA